MTPDQWKELLNLGLPTAALIAIVIAGYKAIRWATSKVVEPLLGVDGAIHRYFRTQSEQYERQGDIAEKHQQLTEELAKSCSTHHVESSAFFKHSTVSIGEIVEVHRHVVNAMKCQFNDEQAIQELAEADAILRRHMRG